MRGDARAAATQAGGEAGDGGQRAPTPGEDEAERDDSWPEETAGSGNSAEPSEADLPPAELSRDVPVEPEALPPEDELPAVEDVVQQIPAPTRALLDELFRAKFSAVRRIPPAALKRHGTGTAD